MNPLVTVIIPTYNSATFICDAIESVLAQTYRNVEIIVVDDGSKDNTAWTVERYLSRIKYLQKPNGGPASARNVGLREAKGEFIAFLDSDDLWLPTKLEKQLAVMEKNPSVGLVACYEYEINPEKTVIGTVTYTNYNNRRKFNDRMVIGNIVGGGSSALIRHECISRLGPFDESLRGTEDWDMWLRIALNYDVRFVPEPLIQARIRTDSVSSAGNVARMLENEIKLLDKLFADKHYNLSNGLHRRSYAYRHFAAAKTLKASGQVMVAREYMLKALKIDPMILLRHNFLKVLIAVWMRG